jgi:hypothetical protein
MTPITNAKTIKMITQPLHLASSGFASAVYNSRDFPIKGGSEMGCASSGDRLIGRRVLGLVLAVVALMVVATAPASAHSRHRPNSLRFKGAPKAKSAGNLIDFGGQITPASHTYAIFWGPAPAWSSDVVPGIDTLFSGFGGSNLLGIAQQYMRNTPISSAYQGHVLDPSTPPKKASLATLAAEVQKEYGSKLDPHGVYFVYTSNFPNSGGFCAWHSSATVNGQNVALAYMPNTSGVAGCEPVRSDRLRGPAVAGQCDLARVHGGGDGYVARLRQLRLGGLRQVRDRRQVCLAVHRPCDPVQQVALAAAGGVEQPRLGLRPGSVARGIERLLARAARRSAFSPKGVSSSPTGSTERG